MTSKCQALVALASFSPYARKKVGIDSFKYGIRSESVVHCLAEGAGVEKGLFPIPTQAVGIREIIRMASYFHAS